MEENQNIFWYIADILTTNFISLIMVADQTGRVFSLVEVIVFLLSLSYICCYLSHRRERECRNLERKPPQEEEKIKFLTFFVPEKDGGQLILLLLPHKEGVKERFF